MDAFEDFDGVSTRLATCSCDRNPCIIAVDGFSGCGKSTFSERLARTLGAVCVEQDGFLIRNSGGYLDNLRYTDLLRHLREIASQKRRILLEGVCVRQVLCRLELTECASVYVKRLGAAGSWPDGEVLEASSAEEAIAHQEKTLLIVSELYGTTAPGNASSLPELEKEVICYHFRFRPHERSTIVYTWSDA